MKRGREKGENVKQKVRKWKEKGNKETKNEKIRSKGVKQVQNREELRLIWHDRSQKTACRERRNV
jgi:hypothetical protein